MNTTPEKKDPIRGWHYAEVGDYHRNLDPNWSYTPTYLRKLDLVRRFVASRPRSDSFIDVGCGEGVMVEEFRRAGHDIQGIDLNYESEFVMHGSVLALPFPNGSKDVVLLLDVFEHLAYVDQPAALREILRVLKPGGHFLVSIPNLGHLNSRFEMLLRGRLDRTDIETNHIGERPRWENLCLLRQAGFHVDRTIGVTLTVPWLYRRVICRQAARYRWLHDALEPIAARLPGLAMLNFFFCRKPPTSVSAHHS